MADALARAHAGGIVEQREPIQRGRVRENFVRGVKLGWEASPPRFVAIALLTGVGALLPPLLVWLSKNLIDVIVQSSRTRLAPSALLPTVIALGVVGALDRVLTVYRSQQQELFAWRVEQHAVRRFLSQASSIDLGHLDNSDLHDRMARARRDINWRPYQLTFSTIGFAGSAVSVVGMLGLLASLHPFLVLLAALSVLPGITIQRRINRSLYEFHFQWTPAEREKNYVLELLTEAGTSKELRAFGLADHLLDRYDTLDKELFLKLAEVYRRVSRTALVTGLLAGLVVAGAYGFAGARGLSGSITPGDLAIVFGAFSTIIAQAGLISGSLLSLEQHATFLDDYFSFLAITPLVLVADPTTPLPDDLAAGLSLRDVHFTYPRGTQEALSGVNLEVRPGELVAMVGENGAGKSTIVNLILRFYDPDRGRVSLGGIDLRVVDPSALRERFGVLFQDFAKLQLSLRENVALGRIERDADDEAIMHALELARADFLVKTMKHGLDSKAGRLFDGGHELSGGEWQRLALARLIHRQADIWILDEPTSNLDPEAEAAIFSELKEQLHGRMGIVISHRFSTVRVADRIYVVQDGRVLESGSHEELMQSHGRYSELFELQAAGYR